MANIINKENITGILLAGGQARRMDGKDKGLLHAAGKPLVAWTLARLMPQVNAMLINANRNTADYAEFGRVIGDKHEGFCGPLAGIHAGIATATTEWALSVPCDSPFLPTTLAATLCRAADAANADIAVAATDNRPQPVFMLLRTCLADNLAEFLSTGGRKIDLWYAQHNHIIADFDDATAFANINTPEELTAAEKRLQQL